jgi:uncharacterized protein (UPF0303 family)
MSISDDIAKLHDQEVQLRFKAFDEAAAWKLGSQMRMAAAARNLPLVIDIHIGNRQLFFAALPGTGPDNSDWARRKRNSVLRFQKSTYLLGREYAARGASFGPERGVDITDYANAGGGFPIHIAGTGIIGAITVSGIPQREDHGFVVEQICVFLGLDHGQIALGPEA